MSDSFHVDLERLWAFRFRADFGSEAIPALLLDEAQPLGRGAGPNPARLLAAAVGNCLGASLLFCLGKSHVEVTSLRVGVTGTYARNERGRLRIGRLDAALAPDVPGDPERLRKCLELFEDFCIVTATVRSGIPVGVVVSDGRGTELYRRDA
jgi:uncharacterized OsmC-like protein